MALIGRDAGLQALFKAFATRGAPAFRLEHGVVPIVQVMDLEEGPYPSHAPFLVGASVAAVAAQLTWMGIGLPTTVPPGSRLYIDLVAWNNAENHIQAFVRDDPAAGTHAKALATDTTLAGLPSAAGGALADVDTIAGNSVAGVRATAWITLPSTNGQRAEYNPRVVLGPGWYFFVQTIGLNVGLNALFRGRYYQG